MVDARAIELQLNRGAADHQLTDAAAAESAADGDTFRTVPILEPEKARDYRGELEREGLDHALHQSRGFDVIGSEEFREVSLVQRFIRHMGKRIAAAFGRAFAPIIENRRESALVGAIPILLVAIAELCAIGVDMHPGQRGRAVHGYAIL